MNYLSDLSYAHEVSMPTVEWTLETDLLFGVDRYVPRMAGETVDLEIRQITRCARDPFGRRVTRERTSWTLVTCDGRNIGEGFHTLEEAQEAANRTVMELWIDRSVSMLSSASIN